MDKQKEPEVFACEVREVYSGDDLMVLVNLGVENLYKMQRVRLFGVDTPNGANAGDDTEAGMVRRQVRSMVRHKRAILRIMSRSSNSWVCVVEIETPAGTISLNQMLCEQGYIFDRKTK